MRVICYLLQAAIVLFGGSVLTALALSSRFALLPFLGFAAFFAFLFFLTLLLREQTRSRIAGREVNPKYIAVFLASIGVGACWLAASVVNGYTGSSTRQGSLLRVSIEVFGPWPAAILFSATGLFLLACAYGMLRRR